MTSTELELRDGIAFLRMTHGKANALDDRFCDHLVERFGQMGADTGVRAVVLTGTGRIFSAGVDLRRLVAGDDAYVRALLPRIAAVVDALFTFPKPLVAAINGHAIAGGCVLACCADWRVMVRSAGRIGVAELRVGLPFPVAALEAVRFACAPQHVQRLVLDGDTYDADAALPLGLVDEVCDADRLDYTAMNHARRFAERPAEAYALTKAQLRRPTLERIAAGRTGDASVLDLWVRPQIRRAVADYVERTMKG